MKDCDGDGCNKKAYKRDNKCHACRKRLWRKNHPEYACFKNWKDNCKRRGKSNDVTFEQFLNFSNENNYLELRGRTADEMSIDRPDGTRGYSIDNMQPMSVSDNAKKYWREEWPTQQQEADPNFQPF